MDSNGSESGTVLGGLDVILPPKSQEVGKSRAKPQIKFLWTPDTIERLKTLAAKSEWSLNEASERLVRWALDRAEAEWEAIEASGKVTHRKKQQE